MTKISNKYQYGMPTTQANHTHQNTTGREYDEISRITTETFNGDSTSVNCELDCDLQPRDATW